MCLRFGTRRHARSATWRRELKDDDAAPRVGRRRRTVATCVDARSFKISNAAWVRNGGQKSDPCLPPPPFFFFFQGKEPQDSIFGLGAVTDPFYFLSWFLARWMMLQATVPLMVVSQQEPQKAVVCHGLSFMRVPISAHLSCCQMSSPIFWRREQGTKEEGKKRKKKEKKNKKKTPTSPPPLIDWSFRGLTLSSPTFVAFFGGNDRRQDLHILSSLSLSLSLSLFLPHSLAHTYCYLQGSILGLENPAIMRSLTQSGRENLAAVIAMIPLTAVMLIIRFAIRASQRQMPFGADWLCLFSAVPFYLYCGFIIHCKFSGTI